MWVPAEECGAVCTRELGGGAATYATGTTTTTTAACPHAAATRGHLLDMRSLEMETRAVLRGRGC